MRNLSKKAKTIIAGAAIAGLASTGVAYAYWTSTGSGAGTASTKTPAVSQLAVASYTSPSNMAPGVDPAAITVTVKNLDSTSTQAQKVVVSIDTVSQATGASGPCGADDYTLASPDMTTGAAELTAATTTGDRTTFSGATLGFADSIANQDGCKGATVHLAFALS